jgi:aminobenzoyl-glutamate utilization protein B
MGQKSMDCAANVIAMTAADLLCDPDIVEKAKAEWVERMDGRVYECLLDDDMEPPIHLNEDVMKKYI